MGNWELVWPTLITQKNVVSRVLCPNIILHTRLVVIDYPTKAKLWLLLETTWNHQSLATELHLKKYLLTLTLQLTSHSWLSSNWLPNLGPFQRPPLDLIPLGRAIKGILKYINILTVGLGNTWISTDFLFQISLDSKFSLFITIWSEKVLKWKVAFAIISWTLTTFWAMLEMKYVSCGSYNVTPLNWTRLVTGHLFSKVVDTKNICQINMCDDKINDVLKIY